MSVVSSLTSFHVSAMIGKTLTPEDFFMPPDLGSVNNVGMYIYVKLWVDLSDS